MASTPRIHWLAQGLAATGQAVLLGGLNSTCGLIKERERRWLEENAEFIAAYNRGVETEGLPLDEWRGFTWHGSMSTATS